MYRKIEEDLKTWKNDYKMPFMLVGARQTGKTYILNEFCKNNFTNYIYINLDKELFNEVEMYLDLVLNIMLKDNFGDILSSMIDSKKLIYFAHRFKEINNILNKFRSICKDEVIEESFIKSIKSNNLDLAVDILFNLPYLTLRRFIVYLIENRNKELEIQKIQERIRDKTA